MTRSRNRLFAEPAVVLRLVISLVLMSLPSLITYQLTLVLYLHTEKSSELTEMAKGKHHIGDFLPPRELEKFLEKVEAIKEGRDPGELERQLYI